MTTKQEQDKEQVRLKLERIWQNYHERVRFYDHELIVLGVPRYPGDIEAVSVMDLQDVADLLAAFAEHRKERPDELHPIEQAAGLTPEQARQALANHIQSRQGAEESYVLGRDASTGAFALGTRHDGGGAPQERAEPPAEPHEGDAADDAVGMTEESCPRCGFLGKRIDTSDIPEAGEGWFKRAKLVMPELTPEQREELCREYEKPGGITWVAPARAPVQEEAINKIFRDLNPAALAAARTPEDVIEVIINGMAMGAGKRDR